MMPPHGSPPSESSAPPVPAKPAAPPSPAEPPLWPPAPPLPPGPLKSSPQPNDQAAMQTATEKTILPKIVMAPLRPSEQQGTAYLSEAMLRQTAPGPELLQSGSRLVLALSAWRFQAAHPPWARGACREIPVGPARR